MALLVGLLFGTVISQNTIDPSMCPGGPITAMDGCTLNCVYPATNGVRWSASADTELTLQNEPIYWSGINCADSSKTNVKVEIGADDDDMVICRMKTNEVSSCFNYYPIVNDPNEAGMTCNRLASNWFGTNDGIIENVGLGEWVFSLELAAGQSSAVEITTMKFTCTDEEPADYTWAFIAGGAAGGLLCSCIAFRFCVGKYLVENCCPCLAICCCGCMFPSDTEFGNKDDCDDYCLYRALSMLLCCGMILRVRPEDERRSEYEIGSEADVEVTELGGDAAGADADTIDAGHEAHE